MRLLLHTEEANLPISPGSVSYTHLDVYKRQLFTGHEPPMVITVPGR